jgi:hypothetical protein
MNFLINLAAKIGGISKLWGFLNGYKTKVAGVGSLLSGLAGIAQQIAFLIEKQDASLVFAFIKGLPMDPSWMMLLVGLGALGIGHKLDKAAEAPKP